MNDNTRCYLVTKNGVTVFPMQALNRMVHLFQTYRPGPWYMLDEQFTLLANRDQNAKQTPLADEGDPRQ
ncbi:hypothetical protein ACIRPT_02750 [Streptomyces sp. NPDC101227]|uniref:hypothetical protein n=1 Tax=Streptomyces sp. NPDC101227 TaxID=3366136 RepID=UPI0037FC0B91